MNRYVHEGSQAVKPALSSHYSMVLDRPILTDSQVAGLAGLLQGLLLAAVCVGAISPIHAQTNYQQIHSFGFRELAGGNPNSQLIEGSDGFFYGTTVGGALFYGTAFRVSKDGRYYRALHQFDTTEGSVVGSLSKGKDGVLYGTSASGIFKLDKNRTAYSRVWELREGLADPSSDVVEGSDGALYLTTRLGGSQGGGTIVRVNRDGSGHKVVHGFDSMNSLDTSNQPNGLLAGGDGVLYGITASGGPSDSWFIQPSGTIFKINQDGSGYAVLHTFGAQADGKRPGSLLRASDGNLYGTTVNGGNDDWGTLFKLATDGTAFRVLLSFGPSGVYGRNPDGITEGPDGLVYGTVSATVFRVGKDGSNYTTLHQFTDNQDAPTVTAGTDGRLYGTTFSGGAQGYGTIYILNINGTGYRLLDSSLWSGGDASSPSIRLVESKVDGMLYGTSSSGGTENAGAVFSLRKDGSVYSVLHNFSLIRGNGAHPAGLIQGSDGVLYGATWAGGSSNVGTVFWLNREGGAFTVLHSFSGDDGSNPVDGVTEGDDGKLYGTTPSGGSANLGTIFSLNKDGTRYSVLWNFTNGANGASSPEAAVIQGSDGALYGTTADTSSTIFRLNKDLEFTVLHRFGGDDTGLASYARLTEGSDGFLYGAALRIDHTKPAAIFKISKDGGGYGVLHRFSFSEGAETFGRPVEGPDGALYGTTSGGAPGGTIGTSGAVFKVNKDGSAFAILHSFDPSVGGGHSPQTGLLMGSDAGFYGVAASGGDMNLGTIFRLSNSPFPSRITALELRSGRAWLKLTGTAGQSYHFQATAKFPPIWVDLGSVLANSDGLCEFLDVAAQQEPLRFYRAESP